MAKKSIDLTKILTIVAAGLGIIALIMIFLPAISVTVLGETATYSGLQTAFGYSEKVTNSISVEIFGFSIMNLLTYVILIAGIVFAILGLLGKGTKFASLIATICFIVAGIFFFLNVPFCVIAEGGSKEYLGLGIGAILGGVLSILAGAASGAKLLMK